MNVPITMLFWAATTTADVRDIAHNFEARRIECSSQMSQIPGSKEELNAVSYNWVTEDTLRVTFWDGEDSDDVIDDKHSQVTLSNRVLSLGYNRRHVEHDPNLLDTGCVTVVKITFLLKAVPRGEYSVHARTRYAAHNIHVAG